MPRSPSSRRPTSPWSDGPANRSPRSIRDLDPRKVTGAPLAVELSEQAGIEILWDMPQQASTVGAWRAADGGWAWRLDYDPESPVPPDELPAGIPALVTIGQREGRQLLIDLEAFGTIAVAGPPECTAAFLRSVALELACGNDLADAYVSIVDVDVDPLVAPAPPPDSADTHGCDRDSGERNRLRQLSDPPRLES